MFKHIEHKIVRPFAKEEHTEDGHFYRTNDGKLYPSITTIFKLLDPKEWYPFWVAKVAKDMNISTKEAEEECEKIGAESMAVGTALHKLAEELLGEIAESMKTTNKLLTQIEINLRVPNMIVWAKKLNDA